MSGVAALLIITLGLLGFELMVGDKGKEVDRWLNVVYGVVALVLMMVVYSYSVWQLVNTGYDYIRPWNGFHYYLGAKYFKELGYFDLYNCALEADKEGNNVWNEVAQVRNLDDYQLIDRLQLPDCPRSKFSNQRWWEFKQDVRFWQQLAGAEGDFWQGVFEDKGYNPSLVWTLIGGSLANRVSLDDEVMIKWWVLSDLIWVVAGLVLVGRAYGWRSGCLAVIFMVSYFGTYDRLVGNFGQYWWLGAVLFSLYFGKINKFLISGVFLGIAAGLRVFPAVLLIPWMIRWLVMTKTKDRADKKFRRTTVFILSTGLTVAGLVVVSGWTGGIDAWQQFYADLMTHGRYLSGELFDLGLKNLWGTMAGGSLDAWERLNWLAEKNWWYWLTAGGWLAMVVKGVVKGEEELRWIWGVVLLYILAVMSPYYYLVLVIPIAILEAVKERWAKAILIGWFGLSLLHALGGWYDYFNDRYLTHLLSEGLVAGFFVLLTGVLLGRKSVRES